MKHSEEMTSILKRSRKNQKDVIKVLEAQIKGFYKGLAVTEDSIQIWEDLRKFYEKEGGIQFIEFYRDYINRMRQMAVSVQGLHDQIAAYENLLAETKAQYGIRKA